MQSYLLLPAPQENTELNAGDLHWAITRAYFTVITAANLAVIYKRNFDFYKALIDVLPKIGLFQATVPGLKE